ncbi:right-handed parallel beta-helix repeat-containing protein [Hymenobacter weizhouensis]|uniref:right-handed parallel beta-helix repeat-containing protein n=1 Tax=Hymenobacter sp. YIM 151500-1 TaxID=2987689 RepID=UPI002226CAB4|nr:right-handed parallel beta-helix repeat-containing protein [Hymenobacter sp. YIM 151500-1]UYZ63626.1 right-handed parallel beta-helix repeat-containing protein [Hymenobacter sp. YIM 151500-1]
MKPNFLIVPAVVGLLGACFSAAPAQVAPRDPQGNVIQVKDTDYAIPAGAVFVSTSGNDANPGTQAQPYRTVRKAIDSAPAGATVVLRAGVYLVPNINLDRRVTVQPYPHEQVWLTGSEPVTGWTQDGTGWRRDNWTVELPAQGTDSPDIDPAFPLAGRPDMVFVNGRALQQVGSRAELGPGKFFVSYADDKLYIGDNPSGNVVEAATQEKAFGMWMRSATDAPTGGSVFRGLGFAHFWRHGLAIAVPRVRVENSSFVWNAQAGVQLFPESGSIGQGSRVGVALNAVVRGNTFSYNGQAGLFGGKAHGLRFENNRVTHNNVERFAKGWSAAGVKLSVADSMYVRNNVFEDNFAHGLWFDTGANNSVVSGNTIRNNQGVGIWVEISKGDLLAGNLLVNNTDDGIRVLNSADVRVYNNTSVGDYSALHIYDSGRQPTQGELNDQANFVTKGVVVKNNILANSTITNEGNALLDTWWYSWGEADGRQPMLAALDYTAYLRSTAAQPRNVARIVLPPNKLTFYQTLAQLQAGTSYEVHGRALDNTALSSVFVDPGAGNYRLLAGSALRGAGEALPADVARALGVAAGVPVDLGAYPQSSTPPPVALQDGQVYELAPQCAPGLRLDVQYSGSANGTRVWLHTANGSAAQRWRAVAAGNGQFELEPLCAPGQRLDVVDGGTGEGSLVQLWQDYSNPQQQWSVQDQGDGTVELVPRHAPARRLDVQRSGTTDGTLVQLYTDNNSAAQRWQLLPVAAAASADAAVSADAAAPATLDAYPNPSPDGRATLRLTAQQAQRATVQVYNQQGQLVSLLTVPLREGPTEFRLPAMLPPGTYYLKTRLDGQPRQFTLRVE